MSQILHTVSLLQPFVNHRIFTSVCRGPTSMNCDEHELGRFEGDTKSVVPYIPVSEVTAVISSAFQVKAFFLRTSEVALSDSVVLNTRQSASRSTLDVNFSDKVSYPPEQTPFTSYV